MAWLLVRSVTGLNFHRMARDSRVWAPFAHFHNPGRLGYDFSLGLRIRYVLRALLFYGLILLSPFRWKILGFLLIPRSDESRDGKDVCSSLIPRLAASSQKKK